MKEKPPFSRFIFWETDYDKIDWENKARYVIERVVEYGTMEDWRLLKTYYGFEKVKQEVLQCRYFRDKTLSFLSVIFQEPVENFRCYIYQQSTQTHFPS